MFTTFPNLPLSARSIPSSPRHLLSSPRHLPSSPGHLPSSPRHYGYGRDVILSPGKPLPHLPSTSKREHRAARVYEPKSPNLPSTFPCRPLPARTIERPAPILELPGLPDVELPRTPVKKHHRFGSSLVKNGKNWLAKIKLPWAPQDPTTPTIPPVSPKTAKFINSSLLHTPKEEKYYNDYQDILNEYLGEDYTPPVTPDIATTVPTEGQSQDPPPLFPKQPVEGGITGWMAVAGAFLIQFVTIGYMFTWNVFEDHYTHVSLTDESPVAIRLVANVQWFFAFFLSLVSGKLVDAGYSHYVVPAGSFLYALSLFLLSTVGEEDLGKTFLFQALGMGIGMGLVFVPTTIVPLYYFKRQRGLVLGITISGGSFGGLVFPIALRNMIPQRGLGLSIRITAIVAAVFLLIGNGLIRPLPKPEKPVYRLPRLDLAKYSKEIEFICAVGGSFLTMLFIFYPVMYLDLLGQERGVNPQSSFDTVITLSVTGLISRIALGYASDIVGPWNLLIPVSGGIALMLFTMCTIQNIQSLVAFSLFYGIFSGAWLSLMITAVSSLATRRTEQGTRVGIVFSVSSIAVLISSLVQNRMVGTNNWTIPSVVSGILLVCVTVLAFLARKQVSFKKPYRRRRVEMIHKVQIV